MNLNLLNSNDIFKRTYELIKKERHVTLEILRLLQEIDRRKIHIERGFPSLFELNWLPSLGILIGADSSKLTRW